jgi:hypothetical protein
MMMMLTATISFNSKAMGLGSMFSNWDTEEE